MAGALLRRVAGAQQGRAFLWWAPAFAAGAGLYFALNREPAAVLAGAAGGLALVFLWFGRAAPLLLLAGMACLGFAAGKLNAEWAAAPLLQASSGEVRITGRVEKVERAAHKRLVLTVTSATIEGLPPEKMPHRLRLSLPEKFGVPATGALLSATARLSPLSAPVQPGGFDYGRTLWFEGIGATGRITAPIAAGVGKLPLTERLGEWLASVRNAMGARIHEALSEPYASIAEALITGERSAIPPEINRSLLISGLFHILSISGLHMWLVAGGVFWVVRAMLALVPGLALEWPIRKWSAAAALLAGLFYMLLADSGVATARSFIMIAVVFFAVMVDRPALSTRNLALAAFMVLALDPETVTEAGFQMSFLAVLGLVAFYESWARVRARREREGKPERHWAMRLIGWGGAALAASIATSFIAGFSSSLAAAYHFGRVSPYGVLANGLAIPVTGVIVMPAALMSALLMPLGLEWLPLQAMAGGLKLVIGISDFIAALPGADMVVARPPAGAMTLIAAGLILLCLLQGAVRLGGLGVMVLGGGLMLWPVPPPDLLIEATGQNVALRDGEGHLVPALPRRARFAVEKWLQANGEEVTMAEAARRPGWSCDGTACVAEVRGRRVLYVSGSEGKAPDCRGIGILIADFPLRGACSGVALRIDRFDLWRSGAQAVWVSGDGLRVETARGVQGARPWTVRPEARAKVFVNPPAQPIDWPSRWGHEAAHDKHPDPPDHERYPQGHRPD